MFDKKVIKKSVIVLLIVIAIITAITLIRRTFSRYESEAESTVEADLAFFVVDESFQSEAFSIGELEPCPDSLNPLDEDTDFNTLLSEENSNYVKIAKFTVRNYNDDIASTVPITYDIIVDATTNIPIEYAIFETDDIDGIENSTITRCDIDEEIYSEDDVYYKQITAKSGGKNASANDFYFRHVTDPDADVEGTATRQSGKETDTLYLVAWLPYYNSDDLVFENVEDDQNYQFADMIDYVKIQIDAKQYVETATP